MKEIILVINENKIVKDQRLIKELRAALEHLKKRNGKYKIRISQYRVPRTENQRTYFHGLVRIISKFTGNDFNSELKYIK